MLLVSFDHALGPIIEFGYPQAYQDDADLNKNLPFLALPDGSHAVRLVCPLLCRSVRGALRRPSFGSRSSRADKWYPLNSAKRTTATFISSTLPSPLEPSLESPAIARSPPRSS